MDYKAIAKKIIELKNADSELRDRLVQSGQLEDGYNEEMEKLHNRNAEILNDIIDGIGYPTIDTVGKKASDAAWLVIQHSIGKPDFMKKCAKLLENIENKNESETKKIAYLTDRIAVFEGKPQLYGTQFDWNENGELSPYLVDDIAKVEQRRKSIGLNTLAEQTKIIRLQAKNDNQSPPANFERRKKEIDAWRRAVGWIK